MLEQLLNKLKNRKNPKTGDFDMSFLDHLEDLRVTIFKILITLIVCISITGAFFTYFNDCLMWPLHHAQDAVGTKIPLRVDTVMSPIMAIFQIAIIGGIAISLPFIVYFIALFIAPALKQKEKKILIPGCLVAIFLFAIGACTAFFGMLPLAIRFSVITSIKMGWDVFYTVSSYYSLLMSLPFCVGIAFELPLILAILIYLEVIKASWLKKNRAYVFLAIIVFAAIITPPDVVSQIMLSVPLYFLYEISIIAGSIFLRKKIKREKQEEEKEEKERQISQKLLEENSKKNKNSENDDDSYDNDFEEYNYDGIYGEFNEEENSLDDDFNNQNLDENKSKNASTSYANKKIMPRQVQKPLSKKDKKKVHKKRKRLSKKKK